MTSNDSNLSHAILVRSLDDTWILFFVFRKNSTLITVDLFEVDTNQLWVLKNGSQIRMLVQQLLQSRTVGVDRLGEFGVISDAKDDITHNVQVVSHHILGFLVEFIVFIKLGGVIVYIIFGSRVFQRFLLLIIEGTFVNYFGFAPSEPRHVVC